MASHFDFPLFFEWEPYFLPEYLRVLPTQTQRLRDRGAQPVSAIAVNPARRQTAYGTVGGLRNLWQMQPLTVQRASTSHKPENGNFGGTVAGANFWAKSTPVAGLRAKRPNFQRCKLRGKATLSTFAQNAKAAHGSRLNAKGQAAWDRTGSALAALGAQKAKFFFAFWQYAKRPL